MNFKDTLRDSRTLSREFVRVSILSRETLKMNLFVNSRHSHDSLGESLEKIHAYEIIKKSIDDSRTLAGFSKFEI